ncbi:hypothetical protein M9435_006215 [Picochlorum sp. BPE23]|nr:hypothetical protein M9435_006215 [Picochlorum sp. BPE23]
MVDQEEVIGGPVTSAQAGCLFVYLLLLLMWACAEFWNWRSSRQASNTHHREHAHEEELEVLVKEENPGTEQAKPAIAQPRTPGGGQTVAYVQKSQGFIQETFLKLIALNSEALKANRENLRSAVEMGTIVFWFYIADRTPAIAAGPKEYIRDVFLFIFLVLTIVASSYSIKQGRAPTLINRQQTEEWKGWMQVLFLLYHYYEAREVYNAIRIFIASYVWMTGFGNFAYYYKTRDFSMGRFCQMMWRLNLLALLCCLALDNEYMLYYICPMHTLYTVMVYAALGLWKSGNDRSYGIWIKFIASFAVVIGCWEYEKVFYTVWAPFRLLLGYTDPRRPNPNAMHEWYFRTGLDRYIWIHGMICAYLHPMFERWLKAVDDKSATTRKSIRIALGSVCVGAMYLWYQHIYTLPKLEYNKIHPYTSWIPITSFLILRNITPSLRLHSLGLYGWLGCITLETYVGQYHTWLLSKVPNSQPIYLLSLLPGYPLLNFSVVTALYIFLSHRLFKMTAVLRDAVIPHDDDATLFKNLMTMVLAGGASYLLGFLATSISQAV